MKYSKPIYLWIIIFSLVLTFCSSKGPYVGKTFNTERWCKFSSGSGSCRYKTEHLRIVATIKKMEIAEEYFLEGFVYMYGLQAFDDVVPGGEDFYMVLAKNNTVVKTVSFCLWKLSR